jgi:hypothetical protein
MNYAILPLLNLDNNKNINNIIKEEKNLRLITYRINNKSTKRINEDDNNISSNKENIKNNMINELLLRNIKRKK